MSEEPLLQGTDHVLDHSPLLTGLLWKGIPGATKRTNTVKGNLDISGNQTGTCISCFCKFCFLQRDAVGVVVPSSRPDCQLIRGRTPAVASKPQPQGSGAFFLRLSNLGEEEEEAYPWK